MDTTQNLAGDLGRIPYVVLAGYLVILLALGWLGYRRSKTEEEDYYLAGRRQGWVVSSLTIMATFFSSFALLGAPGMVYKEGVVFALFSLNVPFSGLCVYLLGARIWRAGREKRYVTPADMISDYYTSKVCLRLLVALTGFLYAIPYVMMQIKAGGEVSAVLFPETDRAFEIGAVLLAAITTLYIMIGGMRSVAWTDVLQGILLMGGMFLGGIAMVSYFGGLSQFGQKISQLPPESLSLPGTTGSWPWSMIFTVCLLASTGSMVQPAQWMRYYAARDTATLRRGAVIFAVVLTACFILGIMLVGLGGQVLYPLEHTPDGVEAHAQVGAYDRILLVVLREQLPEMLPRLGMVLAALVIVAVMASSMSTADSNLHALSAVVVRDVYDRYVRPQSSEHERVWVGRIVIVIASAASLFFVIQGELARRADTPYQFMEMIALLGLTAIAFSAQLLPIAVDMLFLRRGSRAGAAWGLAAGLLGALVFGRLFDPLVQLIQSPQALVQLHGWAAGCQSAFPMHASAWGLMLNAPVFALVSLVTAKVPEAHKGDFARMICGTGSS